MKQFLLAVITTAAIFMIAGCEQFTTSYQRVDDGEFRLLDFIYDSADASPGDTVTLTAVFAGKKIDDLANDIKWEISFDIKYNLMLGTRTVYDSMPLEKFTTGTPQTYAPDRRPHPNWPNAQVIEFKIHIPDNIIRNSSHVPEQWADMLPNIPPEFMEMTKNQIIDTLESVLKNPTGAAGGNGGGGGSGLSIQNIDYFPLLLQVFTVPIRVTAKISEEHNGLPLPHTIYSYHAIRYNRRVKERLKNVSGVYVNNKPNIEKVVVYKVKGNNVSSINNKSGLEYDSVVLDKTGDSVVTVENGYTYFLDALSNNLDSAMIFIDNKMKPSEPEKHHQYRQFQLHNVDNGIHHTRYMDIDNNNGKIILPTDKRITDFTFWVTVKDELFGELNRPDASNLVEVSGRFEYK